MPKLKNKFKKIQQSHLFVAGVLFLILLAVVLFVFLLFFNNSNNTQSDLALSGDIYFEGEYRIEDGPWQKIVEGEHISSTQGDVTLRGNFHMRAPEPDCTYFGIYRGEEPIAFYTDHINVTFIEGEFDRLDIEDPSFGDFSCGEHWIPYKVTSESDTTISILIHNPHKFGNENAIDEMLSNISSWTANNAFEKGVMDSGSLQKTMGLLFVIVAFVILGTALFSTLIHIKNAKIIWLPGVIILFAGIYFAYTSKGVSFWSYSIVANTTILGMSMMFYMFFFVMVIACFLSVTKKIAKITVILLGIANAVFFALPIITDIYFYDTWIWWIALQILANAVFMVCLVKEFLNSKTNLKWFYVGAFLPLIAFAVDAVGLGLGAWNSGIVSQFVFIILFAAAMIMILKFIPNNINAAAKAKELEMEKIVLNAELAETRVSTMMSQIRPHFIYNTLGSIEQLCELDPPKAGELVHNFAKYLRGNFRELDNPKPILMSQEMEHVRHYVSIENVRFPDMTFSFEMNSDDFHIPALTVQPIVENAIKHGLMKLQTGGTIQVISYETETNYCVSIKDNGVGFDTSLLLDERKHIGLRNIRERLKVMVNGTIKIDSTVGVGTRVLIEIPKEEKNDRYSS